MSFYSFQCCCDGLHALSTDVPTYYLALTSDIITIAASQHSRALTSLDTILLTVLYNRPHILGTGWCYRTSTNNSICLLYMHMITQISALFHVSLLYNEDNMLPSSMCIWATCWVWPINQQAMNVTSYMHQTQQLTSIVYTIVTAVSVVYRHITVPSIMWARHVATDSDVHLFL